MLQRMGIRSKMLLTVAVPLFVLLLTGLGVVAFSWLDLRTARNAETVIAALDEARDLAAATSQERYYTANFLDAFQTGRALQTAARNETNANYATILTNLDAVDEGDDEAVAAAESVRTQLTALVGTTGNLVPNLRALAVESTEEGLSFPTPDRATQLRDRPESWRMHLSRLRPLPCPYLLTEGRGQG